MMGKHIKTKMDYDMIEQLAREVARLDPSNKVLAHFTSMDNFEGGELRKAIADVEPNKVWGILCSDCRG